MNTVSRSNTSTSGSATSPCTRSGMPISCRRSSTRRTRAISVTPAAEWVVAWAGYSLTAANTPSAKPRATMSASVASVR